MFKFRIALVFLAILSMSLVTPGFACILLSSTSNVDVVSSSSVAEQSRPLTIAIIGNESYLQVGEGLTIKLDRSLGKTVGNRTMYDYDSLRRLPVSLIIDFENLQDKDSVLDRVIALGGVVNITYTRLPMVAATVPAENVSSLDGGGLSLTPFSDVTVRAFLNESVPLIKPPVEWATLEQKVGKGVNGTGISIAILDTGINGSHPDFYFDNGTSKITFSASMVRGEDLRDYAGHGTHVAGIAAGTGKASGYRFVGVAPGASLYNIKVLDKYGGGYESGVIAGIELAVNHTASIINLSLGANVNTDGTDPMSLACDWAADQGVTVVVAAGNAGPGESTVGTPGSSRKAITVGASSNHDAIADFSSRGPTYDFRIKPDVVAPGVNITAAASVGSYVWTYLTEHSPSKIVGNFYYTLDGTSMATPHVAGVAALLKELHPTWTPGMVKAAIMNSAKDLNRTSFDQGSGRVNAYSAATIPVLAVDPSLSFGIVQAGTSVIGTTLYNVAESPQTITATSVDTYQVVNKTRVPFVSTDIAPPVTIPVGGSVGGGIMLDLPEDAPCDYYDGVLRLSVNDATVTVPYNFVYKSVILARATFGNIALNAMFFAYDFSNPARMFGSGVSRIIVPGGTFVVHAMSDRISSSEGSPKLNTFAAMFLLTDVVHVEKGSVIHVNMSLDAARRINVTNEGVDGRSFQGWESQRQLFLYVNNLTVAGYMAAGAGKVESLYLSDTQEDIFFNTVVYIAGTKISGQEFPGAENSDAFYSLSWLLHGVNNETSNFSCDQGDAVKYTLKYKSDGPPGEWLGVAYYDFAPDPSGQSLSRWAISIMWTVYPGVLRNLYVKYVDWNWNDKSKREIVQTEYDHVVNVDGVELLGPLVISSLNPRDDENKTLVMLEPPYQTRFTVQSHSGQTSCDYMITTTGAPFPRVWAGNFDANMITVSREGIGIPWNASIVGWAGAEAFYFSSGEAGVYDVNVSRATGLTLWSNVEALAQFTVPSADENPPHITYMDVNPAFNSNDPNLRVSFNASDDFGVQYATLWYSYDHSADWTSVSLTRSGNSFKASVPLSESVQNVSLRIKVYDDFNNSVQYTISQVSKRGPKSLTLSAPSNIGVMLGSYLSPVPLTASDATLGTYALQFYENDSFVGNVMVIGGRLGGYLGYSYKTLPVCGTVRLKFVQDVSATYYSSSAQIILEVGWPVTFRQSGVGSEFKGTILYVDGTALSISDLPKTFFWGTGTIHTFAYQAALVVPSGPRQYDWHSTNGLSTLQSGSITVTGPASVTGNYITLVHDLAVTSVVPDRTWVYQGHGARINVTVQNKGDFGEEATVVLYYNITANEIIGTQNVTLLVGETKTLSFEWNTIGTSSCGNYTLTAVATIPADITIADNTITGARMKVRLLGDLNGDDRIDIKDLGEAAKAFGSYGPDSVRPGSPPSQRWDPNADMNQDGTVDIRDLALIAKNFGKSYP